ncbi:hypothetical protein [Paraburkholderia sp. BCC1886]|uniref:hypothetical protein n=1 Tax=Paraburkholderia sp. BCC1886 TaxID=2562670 RepID=UPI001642EA32|nr:hypothetical protein [Paraburkholderia sp. BCC1886]
MADSSIARLPDIAFGSFLQQRAFQWAQVYSLLEREQGTALASVDAIVSFCFVERT